MSPRAIVLLVGFVTSLMAGAAPEMPPVITDRPLAVQAKLGPAQAMFQSQLLGGLDHPVGQAITVAGTTVAARLGDKGQLELDLTGEGKFKTYSKSTTITVPVTAAGAKQPVKLSLYLNRTADGWTYRNASQLTIAIGPEAWWVCDVNGDGTFNQPGIDGMTLAGHEWLFPLPTTQERFCSTALDLTGLTLTPVGEEVQLSGRPLVTTVPAALAVLKGVNVERLRIGLTPRPEDVKLSAELQAHCAYMALNKTLTHPEDKSKPGYTPEGHSAGMRSILSMGTAADRVAWMMVQTYFHRQDVIRPETLAFGVGYEGSYGGIDGRSAMGKAPATWWPVLYPVPGQRECGLTYQKEAPDATPGDGSAGLPITAYFATRDLKLTAWTLTPVEGVKVPAPVDCYVFDPSTGVEARMTGYQRCVALIPKEPLQGAATYEVSMEVAVAGKPWKRTWQFSTVGASKPRR